MYDLIKLFPFTLFIWLASFQGVFSQSINSDSLKQVLANATEDSVKVKVLIELGNGDNYSDREELIGYYRQALEFEMSEHQRAEILNKIGYAHWQLGNYEEAISVYSEALDYFQEINDSTFLGLIYNNIATANWGLGDNLEALKNYQLSLQIRREINDKRGVSLVLNNIGKLYQELGLFDKAFIMHKEALELSTEIDDVNVIAYSYANIGDCYENFDDLENALTNFKKGFNVLYRVDKRNRSNSYFSSRIGGVYFKLNKPDSALYYNRKALDYANRINNKNRIALAQYHLGTIFFEINQIDSAEFYFEKSYDTAIEKGYTVLTKDNLFSLANVKEKRGNTIEAFQLFKNASALNDSIYTEDVVAKIADIQVKYVNAQQEQENALLRKNNEIQEITIHQQRTFTLFLIVIALLIIITLFFINKSRTSIKKLNKQLEKSEKELKQANAEKDKFFAIISHDLKSPFNGLLGLTEVLESKYDSLPQEEVKHLLSLLRQTAKNSYSLLEDLLQWSRIQIESMEYKPEVFNMSTKTEKVIQTLDTSIKNKNINLENRINNDTFVFADEKSAEAVLRNLISNAIKFTNNGGNITLEAIEKDTEYIFSVCDNGIGMAKNTVDKLFSITEKISVPGTNNEMGTGLGLVLCKEFIEKNNGKIWVESEIDKGSTFYFTLPRK